MRQQRQCKSYETDFLKLLHPFKELPSSNRSNAVFIYSGLTLNQDKATKPQIVQIVRQGEATLY